MNTIYKIYDRFIDAAKKFPRWNNTKRRPTESVGGKFLRSIIEEIGKVEDAIIEYKKDFFIVNYIGKEDTIVDYLYHAQIGAVEDLDKLQIQMPQLSITSDIEEFYANKDYAYYQDGYLVFRQAADSVEYTYNGFIYKTDAEKFHVWNIFDEFAWWVGLERFTDETNKELVNRTINIFRYRPNSSFSGLKNAVKNTLYNYGNIDEEEIIFEGPDEDNLYNLNESGQSLYEEIAQFNRDIARTKKWDMDYWDNSFRKLGYIAHKWDEPVKNYKDGVGYNNSLLVSTVKDLNIDQYTNVTINGYKKSTAKIEEYIKSQNINKNIELSLLRYNNEINPVPVQYKITASTLTEIKDPKSIFIDAYTTSNVEKEYYLDDLYKSKENVSIIKRNGLETNTKYRLKLFPDKPTMEISKCVLKTAENTVNLLTEKGNFGYNDRGLFCNKSVLAHYTSITDFNISRNIKDYRYGGITLNEALQEGYFEVNISGFTEENAQPLTIKSECELYSIMSNPSYIKVQDFDYIEGSYVSGSSMSSPSILTIELLGRDIEFELDKYSSGDLTSGYVDIETYIDGTLSLTNSYYNVSVSNFKKYSLKQYQMHDVKVIVKRNSTTRVKISNIKVSRYNIKIKTSDGQDITPTQKESTVIPQIQGACYLYVTIENYGQTSPIINYVHIGATLNQLTSTYWIDIDTSDAKNPELLIESNCKIELYKDDKIIEYSPYNLYVNESKEIQGIYLDLSGFKNISYSNPQIKHNSSGSYILLEPGKSIESITIYGDSEELISRYTLQDVLNIDINERLYVNKNIKGFIKTHNTGTEELIFLTEKMCAPKDADTYRIWSNSYKNIEVCYISNSNKNAESISEKYSGRFDSVYLYDKESKDYIAYNNQNIIKNKTDNVSIIKNFMPALPENQNFLFYIDDIITRSVYDFDVVFENNNRWSISINKKIIITTNIDISNSGVLNTEIKNINQNFILSNNIELSDKYIINDQEIELGKYILTPPSNMKIVYEEVTVTQLKNEDGSVIYVEEDGFNKLLYSNIIKINTLKLNGTVSTDYRLLSEEGIIEWVNDDNIGAVVEVNYTYQKPKYLTFSSLDYLYEIVGYQIDTLEKVETVNDYTVKNAEDGTLINIDYDYFYEKPDKILAQCSNECYIGVFNNDSILIKKIGEDNNIVIHNGYYYIDGNEYWYFSDRYEFDQERLDGVEMNNVDKSDKDLIFKQEAENYLKNSKMLCNHLATHCIIDFDYYRNVPNISSLDHIGACESFSNWYSYKMEVDLSSDYDGHAIVFNAEDDNGYAILDITYALNNNRLISCWYEGNLSVYLGREIKIASQQLSKTLYVEKFAPFTIFQDKAYYDGKDLNIDDYRYYIIINGSGTLIETLISDSNSDISNINNNHKKAIDKIGFTINEEIESKNKIELEFDPVGMIYSDLEMTKDLLIQTGTTADWGVTKFKEYDLQEISHNQFLYRNNALIAQTEDAWIETSAVKIPYKKAVLNAFLKINDYPYGDLKDFTVKVLGATVSNGVYSEIMTVKDINQVIIQSSKLPNYLKFRITCAEKKVVNHLELFLQYREDPNETVKVTDNASGSCTTKLFDTCVAANYKVADIAAETVDDENIRYEVRAVKKVENDMVWTAWYDYNDKHEFYNYRLFQFRITLKNSKAKVKIKKFVLEVL